MKKIISLIILTLIILSCAGREEAGMIKKTTRFIPDEKKTLYISLIHNFTNKIKLDDELYNYMVDYFKYYGELTYTPIISSGDIVLSCKITDYKYSVIEYFDAAMTHEKKVRLFIRINIKLQDRVSKEYYIEDKSLETSIVFEKEGFESRTEFEARKEMFDKLSLYIDQIILYGAPQSYSQYGYEDLEREKSGNLIISDEEAKEKQKNDEESLKEAIEERDKRGGDY